MVINHGTDECDLALFKGFITLRVTTPVRKMMQASQVISWSFSKVQSQVEKIVRDQRVITVHASTEPSVY